MKRTVLVTALTSIVMIALFFVGYKIYGNKEETTIKAGFIYVGDGANPYTENFLLAQEKIEEEYGQRVECIAKYNVSEGHEAECIEELCTQGCDIIFGTSYGYGEAMKEAAKVHPDIQFCQATSSNAVTEPIVSNYHTYMGHIYEGRYVSGVVAGMKLNELISTGKITKDQAMVGYVAAYPYSEVISGYTAFFLGVRSVCENARMIVKYTNTWNGYTIEKEYASELINEGCVIISQHSDTTGPAVACENAEADHPVYLISYNQSMIDVAPTCALTGCHINWTSYEVCAVGAVLEKKVIEDNFKGDVTVNPQDVGAGFSEGWVEMLEFNEITIADNTEEMVEEIIKKIENDEIEIFSGNYTGTDPFDSSDTIDLSKGYKENATCSAPLFHYVLDDVITVED